MRYVVMSMGVLLTSAASAEIPLLVSTSGDYSIEAQVLRNGETLCDISLSPQNSRYDKPDDTSCRFDLTDMSEIEIQGTYSDRHMSGSFKGSNTIFDLSPWTTVLRDPTLEFSTRLERFNEAIVTLGPSQQGWFTKTERDVPGDPLTRDPIFTKRPAEFAAFERQDVRIWDNAFTGPAFVSREWRDFPPTWPTLTQYDLNYGWSESQLPAEGSEQRAWNDRVRVIYFQHDGTEIILWDPDVAAGQPTYFWMDTQTRDVYPAVTFDGTLVETREALVSLILSSIRGWGEEGFESWIDKAAQSAGVIPEGTVVPLDGQIIPSDLSAPGGALVLSFSEGRNIPVFKTVTPHMEFFEHTWWNTR